MTTTIAEIENPFHSVKTRIVRNETQNNKHRYLKSKNNQTKNSTFSPPPKKKKEGKKERERKRGRKKIQSHICVWKSNAPEREWMRLPQTRISSHDAPSIHAYHTLRLTKCTSFSANRSNKQKRSKKPNQQRRRQKHKGKKFEKLTNRETEKYL